MIRRLLRRLAWALVRDEVESRIAASEARVTIPMMHGFAAIKHQSAALEFASEAIDIVRAQSITRNNMILSRPDGVTMEFKPDGTAMSADDASPATKH